MYMKMLQIMPSTNRESGALSILACAMASAVALMPESPQMVVRFSMLPINMQPSRLPSHTSSSPAV